MKKEMKKIINFFNQKDYIPIESYNNIKQIHIKLYKKIYIKLRYYKYINIDKFFQEHNQNIINNKIIESSYITDNINGVSLDHNQKEAVVSEENKLLIIAGAGSGKSLTIIGKIKYLIMHKKYKEKEILCISFTNETTKSLKSKLKKMYNFDIEVLTFHKLALKIIKLNSNIKYKIETENLLENIISDYIDQKLHDKSFFFKIADLFENYISIPEIDELNINDIESYIKDILYIYDIKFKLKKNKYALIFSIYNFKIYYFSLNVDSLNYIKTVKNKKNIELYYPFFLEKIFLSTLIKKIGNKNISLKINKEKLYLCYIKNNYNYFKNLKLLLKNFIKLYYANDINHLNNVNSKKKVLFVEIINDIIKLYNSTLENQNKIDFDTMIKKATILLDKNKKINKYKYIIIDEFQDTSILRFNLIKKIIELTNSKLMVVGDDFQSIYQFSGCSASLFLNHSYHLKNAKVIQINNTYRNSQELIAIAGDFVMKNKRQIPKKLVSKLKEKNPIKIVYSNNLKYDISNIIKKENKNTLILGRNNSDINLILSEQIYISDNKLKLKNSSIKIKFLTIHKSKGLEEDNVIIVNLIDSPNSLPSLHDQDEVMDLIPLEPMIDEERRLFYVALTRTKKFVYLFTEKEKESIFIQELIKDYKEKIDIIDLQNNDQS